MQFGLLTLNWAVANRSLPVHIMYQPEPGQRLVLNYDVKPKLHSIINSVTKENKEKKIEG